ncbi:PEP-CTERM sorting domain-containing protein [Kamptonema cortianum]|nr:PEP-CTERM sorting domain-containing protein [Geitlerinema splendidum]MDK3162500.1 PEP-CTERM sorting domain-containing protein [Kamptonema cortianum]
MKKLLMIVAAGACVSAAHAAFLIDDFTSGFNGMTTNSSFYYDTVAPAALGGHRYVEHRFFSNPLGRPITTDVNVGFPGHMFIESGSGVSADVFLAWGGRLNAGVPTSGAGGLTRGDFFGLVPRADLTNEAGFVIDYINNDQSSTSLYLEFWDSNFNVDFVFVGGVAAGNGSVFVPMASFGNTANRADIRGIALGVGLPNGNDITLTKVEVVPEPATMAILGLGALALARRKRRS